jgi:NAD(P)-dependent dehydrogenase (short-subunit alcohol dehydrogenase family)
MTPAASFSRRAVALFGLGGSGLSTARALMAGGAHVAAWDDGEASRQRALAQGVTLEDLTEADWSRFAALILSPGVPLTHPTPHWTVRKAMAAGGTSQRLNPGLATVASRERKLMVRKNAVLATYHTHRQDNSSLQLDSPQCFPPRPGIDFDEGF